LQATAGASKRFFCSSDITVLNPESVLDTIMRLTRWPCLLSQAVSSPPQAERNVRDALRNDQ